MLQQRDIAGELLGQRFLAHRVAAVLHDDGGPGVAAQERQRRGERDRLLSGGFQVDSRGPVILGPRRGAGGCRLGRTAPRPWAVRADEGAQPAWLGDAWQRSRSAASAVTAGV